MRFKTKCIDAYSVEDKKGKEKHVLELTVEKNNAGLFGSKIIHEQFEKVESVLTKRYLKLPFGIRLIY